MDTTVANHRQRSTSLLTLLRWIVLALGMAVVLVPFAYLLLNSVKLPRDLQAVPPVIVPSTITGANYAKLFLDPNSPTLRYLVNSLIVVITTTAVTVGLATLAAYGLARLRLPYHGATVIALVFLLVRFYPKITTVLPYYILMRQFRLLDTLLAIILAHVGLTLPLAVWLLLGFFNDLPIEIEQSAMIDGCGPWQRLRLIVLPLTTPGLLTVAILTALLSWNEFLLASSVSGLKAKTLPVAVASFITDKGLDWGAMAAMSTVIVVPTLLFALFAQRALVRGLTLGAVKE